jgi:O-antigen/teichoic acid export membrane protein
MLEKIKLKIFGALRWSEKHTQTDMVYLAKGGFWLIISQVISSLASLVLVIAFANLISAELYGNYRYIISIIGMLSAATFPGINSMAIKSVANGDEDTFWKLLKKRGVWSLASTGASLLLSLYYQINGNTNLSTILVIVAIAIPLSSVVGMYSAFLNGKKDFRRLAQWSTLARLVVTASFIIILPFVDSLFALFLLYFIPEMLVESFFLIILYRRKTSKIPAERSNIKKLTKFGFHLSLMEVLKTIAGQADKILIFHYLGAAELAIYTIATTAPSQIKSVLQNISTLAWPKFSSAKEENIRTTLPAKLFKLELIIIGLVAIYWIAAPFLFPIFFPKYASAVFISQIYSLSLLFFPRTFFSTAMTAQLKQKEMYAIRIFAPIIRITVFAIALPFWGLWGAIIGSIISSILTAVIYQFFFKRAFPRSIKNIAPCHPK